jgi:hypothetical protein
MAACAVISKHNELNPLGATVRVPRGFLVNGKQVMYSMIPGEALSGALEIVCYSFTAAAAVVSCLFSLRF